MKDGILKLVAPGALAYVFGSKNPIHFICFWLYNNI